MVVIAQSQPLSGIPPDRQRPVEMPNGRAVTGKGGDGRRRAQEGGGARRMPNRPAQRGWRLRPGGGRKALGGEQMQIGADIGVDDGGGQALLPQVPQQHRRAKGRLGRFDRRRLD